MFDEVKFLVLWITNDCNLRCKYCYANAGDKKEYMSFETAKKVLEIPKGKFKLQLAGGEPLLNFELVRKIHEYLKESNPNVKIQMQTNGSLITSDIAREIQEMNIAVGISLDGIPKINEYLRGNTEAVINGIKTLAREGVMVNLNCVVTEDSIEYLSKLVDLAFYLGNVFGIGLDLLRQTGKACSNNVRKASPNQIKKSLIAAYARSNELFNLSGRRIIIREVDEARKRITQKTNCRDYCHAVYGGSMVVFPDGSLYPCGSLSNGCDYYMGNIHDVASQKLIKLSYSPSEICKACRYEKICVGACPARSIINSDNSGFTIEDCSLRKTSFEIIEEENNLR